MSPSITADLPPGHPPGSREGGAHELAFPGIAFAALFLGERLTWQHYLGGALTVSGTVILAWR
jgi:hypothetical protein